MKKYIEYWTLLFFYYFFKIIGLRASSFLGGMTLSLYGIFSKRNKIIEKNLNIAFPNLNKRKKKIIIKKMWFHFGRVVGEYPNLNKLNVEKIF